MYAHLNLSTERNLNPRFANTCLKNKKKEKRIFPPRRLSLTAIRERYHPLTSQPINQKRRRSLPVCALRLILARAHTHAPPWKVTKPPEPEIRDTRERIQLASRFGPSLISLPSPSSSRLSPPPPAPCPFRQPGHSL